MYIFLNEGGWRCVFDQLYNGGRGFMIIGDLWLYSSSTDFTVSKFFLSKIGTSF